MSNEYEVRLKNIFLDPKLIQSFNQNSIPLNYKKDEVIKKLNEQNSNFMVLQSGTISPSLNFIPIGTIQQTIKCQNDCILRSIDNKEYERLQKGKLIFQKSIQEFLNKMSMFKEIKYFQISFSLEYYKYGQVCLHELDMSKQLYIILEGEFLIRKKWNKQYINVGQISRGEILNDYECLNNLKQQFEIICNSQYATLIKLDDFKRNIDINQFIKIAQEKFNHRLQRFKRMTDFKSGNCEYQQPIEPQILPLRDIANRVQTSQSKQRQPLPIYINEEIKKKVLIKNGTYKPEIVRKRTMSQGC